MYIYRLSHALGDLGHTVDVIHDIDSYHLLHPAKPEIDFDEHPRVTRHGLRSRYGFLSPLLTQQTGKPLLKSRVIQQVLDSKPYDIIHYHNISLLGPEILTLRPLNGDPIKLYTTHEHWLICPTHVLWKFNQRACEKPACLRCTLLAKRPPQLWRYTGLLEKASQAVDRFLSPSRFTARMHANRGFPQPVHHLPYFIERADEDWQNPGPRPQENPYFLLVGRLEKIKGFQNVVRIWEQVGDIDLLTAGSGTYEEELRMLAAGNDRVKFLGPLPQRELGALYYHALATIVPSLTYETFGIVVVESFARKTPALVHDLGALPEIIEDSGGGLVFANDQELIAGIRQIASSPEFRTELGENGYRAFVQQWSPEAHIALYFDLLKEIALEKYGYVPWEI